MCIRWWIRWGFGGSSSGTRHVLDKTLWIITSEALDRKWSDITTINRIEGIVIRFSLPCKLTWTFSVLLELSDILSQCGIVVADIPIKGCIRPGLEDSNSNPDLVQHYGTHIVEYFGCKCRWKSPVFRILIATDTVLPESAGMAGWSSVRDISNNLFPLKEETFPVVT